MTKPKKREKEKLKVIFDKVTEPKVEELTAVFYKKGKPVATICKVDRIPPIKRKRTSKKRK